MGNVGGGFFEKQCRPNCKPCETCDDLPDSCETTAANAKSLWNYNGRPRKFSKRCTLDHELIVACRSGDAEALTKALHDGACLEARHPFSMRIGSPSDDWTPTPGLTPLMHAVAGGYEKCVQILLENGADVHAVDESGMQPLHFAASFAEVEIAKRLIMAGASANREDMDGKDPLNHLPDEVVKSSRDLREWQDILKIPGRKPEASVMVPNASSM